MFNIEKSLSGQEEGEHSNREKAKDMNRSSATKYTSMD